MLTKTTKLRPGDIVWFGREGRFYQIVKGGEPHASGRIKHYAIPQNFDQPTRVFFPEDVLLYHRGDK